MIESVHTENFPGLLEQLNISIFVTTYQAGKLFIIRADNGIINTHFRDISKPMGMFVNKKMLVVGAKNEVLVYRNMPVLSKALEPVDKHDACFVLRRRYITGDVNIHEISEFHNRIWFVNTRFSAICTFDDENSFKPEWLPPQISRLAGEDRCHLNGFCFDENGLKYATALGRTDTAKGWREHKANGGVLVDCQRDTTLLDNLSMPHSPRFNQDRFWLLESGKGGLGFVDKKSRKYTEVVKVPGFTRGLDLYGRLAFVGLSKLRGSKVFRDIPLESYCDEPQAGVWVIDILTGETVSFLRFETGVEEIFAVSVLTGTRFPEVLEHDNSLIDNSYTIDNRFL